MPKLIFIFIVLLPNTLLAESVYVKVKTAKVVESTMPVVATGHIAHRSEQALTYLVKGIIEQVAANQGDRVKKGQVLARLNMEEIDAQVTKAEALLAQAKKDLVRITSLSRQSLASEELLQQTKTALTLAQSDLRIVRFNRLHAEIIAPQDGIILRRDVEPNEWIQLGKQAFVFAADKSDWVVNLSVADKDVVRLKIGDTAKIKLDAYPNHQFEARIIEIAAQANHRIQTFGIQLRLKQPSVNLLSGLIAHVIIEPSETQSVILMPVSSLLSATGKTAQVYVVNDSMAEIRQVDVAFVNAGLVAISNGLQEGEQIITQGTPFVVPMEPVQIAN
jgi:multidrug efflux system membrane fusion protein